MPEEIGFAHTPYSNTYILINTQEVGPDTALKAL